MVLRATSSKKNCKHTGRVVAPFIGVISQLPVYKAMYRGCLTPFITIELVGGCITQENCLGATPGAGYN